MWRVTGTFFLSPLTRYFRPYTFVLTTISGVQSSSFINSFTQAQIPFLTITERFKCRWLVESYYKPWKWRDDAATAILGSLSYGIFERGTSTGSRSTGSEVFFILKHLDAPKFVFLSVWTIIETICPKIWAKPPSKNEETTTSGWRASLKNILAFHRTTVRSTHYQSPGHTGSPLSRATIDLNYLPNLPKLLTW